MSYFSGLLTGTDIHVLQNWSVFFPVAQIVTNFTRIPFAGRLGLRFRCPRLSVEQVSVFGDEFDELWGSNKHSYGVTAVRDKTSLNWRHQRLPVSPAGTL